MKEERLFVKASEPHEVLRCRLNPRSQEPKQKAPKDRTAEFRRSSCSNETFAMARKRTKETGTGNLFEAGLTLLGVPMILLFAAKPLGGTQAFHSILPLLVGMMLLGAGILIFIAVRIFAASGNPVLQVVDAGRNLAEPSNPREPQPQPQAAVRRISASQRKFENWLNTRAAAPVAESIPGVEARLPLQHQVRALDWFQFEKLVELIYRKRGYAVERRGGARPDGGLDLVLGCGPDAAGVQCKHWQNREVGVRHVRELLGTLQDSRLLRGILIGLSGFTADARDLAARHRIELVTEHDLLKHLSAVDANYDPNFRAIFDSREKLCPRCESKMILRTPRKGGQTFWGCSHG